MRASTVICCIAAIAAANLISRSSPASAGGAASAYKAAVLADMPVAYYRLDESTAGRAVPNGTNMVDAAFSNTGSYVAGGAGAIERVGSLTAADTAADSAARFSAAGLGATRNYWRLHFLYAMTVEAWVVWRGQPTGTIASFGDASRMPYDNYRLGYDAATHKLAYQIAVGHAAHAVEAVMPQPNVVYHIVGTFDGTVQRLYINGVLRAAQRLHGAIGDYNPSAALGFTIANDSTRLHPVSAIVDEVALYPTALSAARIAAHYLTGSPVAPYTIAALSSGSSDAYVGGMNEAGDIAGASPSSSATGPAVYSAAGRVISLGLAGALPYAINDRGIVLAARGSDGLYRCAVASATCAPLQTLPLACPENNTPYTTPGGLNNAGVVAGTETNVLCSGPTQVVAVKWDASGAPSRVFPPTNLFTQGYAVDDAGTTLGGRGQALTGPFAPILVGPGTLRAVGFFSYGTTVAHNGDVLGSMFSSCEYGVVRTDGYAFALPLVPIPFSSAQSMNALDEAVGYGVLPKCLNDGTGSVSAAGETQALPLSILIPAGAGWSNLKPIAINDRGEIAGTGTHGGLQYVFKMTPYPF